MAKFKDFSRYKNNRLKYYFFQQAIKEYANYKEKKEEELNPNGDFIFSGILTIILSRKITNLLECLDRSLKSWLDIKTNSFILDFLLYLQDLLLLIIHIIFLFAVYMIMMILYNKFFHKMVINIRKWGKPNIRNSNPDNLLPAEERTPQAVLNKFTHGVSDQIALALNITSSLDILNKEHIPENHYYLNEAFSYTLNAMGQLSSLLFLSADFARHQGDNFNLVSKHRMENLIVLAEKIKQKISDFWKNNGCYEEHERELANIDLLIKNIKDILNPKKNESQNAET